MEAITRFAKLPIEHGSDNIIMPSLKLCKLLIAASLIEEVQGKTYTEKNFHVSLEIFSTEKRKN